jgi:hypothetical protein
MNTSKMTQSNPANSAGVTVDHTGKGRGPYSGARSVPGHCEQSPLVLGKAIDALPQIERLVLSLHYCEGLNAGEIGMVLDLKDAKILDIMSRALRSLRKRLPVV